MCSPNSVGFQCLCRGQAGRCRGKFGATLGRMNFLVLLPLSAVFGARETLWCLLCSNVMRFFRPEALLFLFNTELLVISTMSEFLEDSGLKGEDALLLLTVLAQLSKSGSQLEVKLLQSLCIAVYSARHLKRAGLALPCYLLVSSSAIFFYSWKSLLDACFLFASTSTLLLLVYWLLCLSIIAAHSKGVLCAKQRSRLQRDIDRKFYHVAALALFIPAYLTSAQLLKVCLSIATAAFIFIENTRRVYEVRPLTRFMLRFRRQQTDSHLSHLFLLIGCALPLWFRNSILGVVALGAGDTASSIVGIKYGRHRWPGSKKTLEGTLAGVACNLLFSKLATGSYNPDGFVASAAWEVWFESCNDNLYVPLIVCAVEAHCSLV